MFVDLNLNEIKKNYVKFYDLKLKNINYYYNFNLIADKIKVKKLQNEININFRMNQKNIYFNRGNIYF